MIMLACAFAPTYQAQTDDLILYMQPSGTASIDVYNTSEGIGNQASWYFPDGLGDTNSTAADHYTLENDGDVNVDVSVNATNTTDWTLNTTADHNKFHVETDNPDVNLDWTFQSFVTDLAVDGTEPFGLTLSMPTTSSTNNLQTSTITFEATAV